MFELNGKYGKCKVFTDNCETSAISQLTQLLNQECIKNSQIRIMPDCHSGAGCVIGTTMTLKDKVIPNLVGVDIGCFAGDTEVWCSAGFYKTIKELAERDEPLMTDTFNTKTCKFSYSIATAFKTRENADLVAVTFGYANSSKEDVTVKCTPDHKFLTCWDENHGELYYNGETFIWVEAAKLKKGTRLIAEDAYIVVKNVQALEEKEDVYCLNVPDYHNFSIKFGVIVHNCGMLTIKLKEKRIDLPMLDSVIRKYVPSGGSVHSEPKTFKTSLDVENLRCYGKKGANIRPMLAYQSVGTLGGGNHFIEINKDSNGNLYLVIHTGSRHLGLEVCDYYQNAGYEALKDKLRDTAINETINAVKEKLRAEKKYNEITPTIAKLKKEYNETKPSIPFELAYVEGELFNDYIYDMKKVQQHASCNRAEIARVILKYAKLTEVERFETIHNYIDTDNMILRKGSISARKDEKVLIPINMRDGSLICIGKGNPDWNYSAPHGAGRLMSRSEAKESISLSDFKKTMKDAGIYSTSVCKDTIDESPFAYKPMEEIIENIKDTVDIVDIIKPIYNFKASGE